MSSEITAQFIMEDNLVAIDKDAMLQEAMFAMFVNRFHRLLVEDDKGIIGIITSSDILSAVQRTGDKSFLKIPVREYMTDKLISVSNQETVINIAKRMQDQIISSILVQNDNEDYVGIITEKDITYYDVLWSNIGNIEIDLRFKKEPIEIINENYSWWQAIDKFNIIDRRELAVKNEEKNTFEGIITKMDILQAINMHSEDIKSDQMFFQLSPIESLYNKHFVFLEAPTTVKRCRRLMNMRGFTSIPIFNQGKLKKIVNQSTMVNYFVMFSEMD